MAAKKRRGPRPQVKGFRPGKEPAHLKKQRAKAELGSRASWAQKAAVDAVAGRSPQEVRAMVRRWRLALIVGAVALGVGGAFLYAWSVPAGVAVHVLAATAAVLAWRVQRSAQGLEDMSRSL